MNKQKIKIISIISILSFVIFGNHVLASSSLISISPENNSVSVGQPFNLNVQLNPSNNKICAVEGKLVLDNLSLQSVTLTSDILPQRTPTKDDPYFLLGIPNCSTNTKTLFTINVIGKNSGNASISFTDVDLIGEGNSLGNNSTGGSYAINPTVAPSDGNIITDDNDIKTVKDNSSRKEIEKKLDIEKILIEENQNNILPDQLKADVGSSNCKIDCGIVYYILSIILGLIAGFILGRKTHILNKIK